MPDLISEFKKNIFNITSSTFEIEALKLFHFQREHCEVYKKYLSNLSISPESIKKIEDIPFLPVEFFKSHKVISSSKQPKVLFESSGTTGSNTSKHYVSDLDFYKKVTLEGFQQQFGSIKDYVVLALLPSYLERKNSSLIYMVQHFIDETDNPNSGFYLNNIDELLDKLKHLQGQQKKVLLIGVSFALLDLAEKVREPLDGNLVVMETGGMKGKRKEMIRTDLHRRLREGLGVKQIFSEYGMTELLSQAYLLKDNVFHAPPWMSILISDVEDPYDIECSGRGVINVVDLANVETCAFIQLQDLGKLNLDGSFEVLGRLDQSDVRGCNLMYI